MRTSEIEYAVARDFGWRTHVIVPNISWGAGLHECDLLVLTKTGYAYEVEIKVSKADLIKDKLKDHGHLSNRIRKLYFAIPDKLKPHIEHIPERAGIICVRESGYCETIREAQTNPLSKPWTDSEMFNIARLGTMRIWTLKKTVNILAEDNRNKSVIAKARELVGDEGK